MSYIQQAIREMNEPKPEALQLADELERWYEEMRPACSFEAATELRRLYREVQRLEAKLDDIHYQNSMNDEVSI